MNKWIQKYKSMPVQIKASLWFMICSVFQKGISVISTPIFTRLMSKQEYGKFNVFLSWQGIAASIIILTLPWGVVEQGLIKFSDKRKEFNSAALGIMTTLSVLWFLIFLTNTTFWCDLLDLSFWQVIALFSIIWTSSVFTFWSINERIDYKYTKLVLLTVIVSVVKPIIGVYAVTHFDDKVTARVLGIAIVEMIAYIYLFIKMMHSGKVFVSLSTWKYILGFSIPLIPHYLSQRILSNSDRIMIDRMCNEGDSGLYSLAYSLSMLMLIVNQAFQGALNPWIYRKIKDKKFGELKKIIYIALLIVALLNLLLIAFAPEAVWIFAPPEYADAIWVVPPVAMSVFFMFMYGFFANVEFYYEKTGMMSIATIIGAIINVILNFIFIKRFGYYAAGYTTLFCYIVYAICHYVFMRQICKKKLDGYKIFNPVILLGISVVFVIIGFVICITYEHMIIRYSIIALLMLVAVVNRKRIINLMRLRKSND